MFKKLWIAFKFWLYWDWKQRIGKHCKRFGVVNCFQILAILGLETTVVRFVRVSVLLWIAFKFWLYWDWKQLCQRLAILEHCCELLSNFGYIGIGNNRTFRTHWIYPVVNCFQILAILGLETTNCQRCQCGLGCELLSNFGYIGIGNNKKHKNCTPNSLWIAFKFWLYWDWKQHIKIIFIIAQCCELLSNFGYIGIGNNREIFLPHIAMLWIAFKFWLYWDWKQLYTEGAFNRLGCELLSNFGYIGIGNNFMWWQKMATNVVNCFQILAILGLETTVDNILPHDKALWIAFKFWLYWDWKQHIHLEHISYYVVNCFQILAILGLETTWWFIQGCGGSCELLSNFGYIGIGNNSKFSHPDCIFVVNCFQILAILGLETTSTRTKM